MGRGMRVKVYEIPKGYEVKKWGHIGNREMWWDSSSQAYLERRLLLRYNRNARPDMWLVYCDKKKNRYTILSRR